MFVTRFPKRHRKFMEEVDHPKGNEQTFFLVLTSKLRNEFSTRGWGFVCALFVRLLINTNWDLGRKFSFAEVNESFSSDFNRAKISPLDGYETQLATISLFKNKLRNNKKKILWIWKIPEQQLNVSEEINNKENLTGTFQYTWTNQKGFFSSLFVFITLFGETQSMNFWFVMSRWCLIAR